MLAQTSFFAVSPAVAAASSRSAKVVRSFSLSTAFPGLECIQPPQVHCGSSLTGMAGLSSRKDQTTISFKTSLSRRTGRIGRDIQLTCHSAMSSLVEVCLLGPPWVLAWREQAKMDSTGSGNTSAISLSVSGSATAYSWSAAVKSLPALLGVIGSAVRLRLLTLHPLPAETTRLSLWGFFPLLLPTRTPASTGQSGRAGRLPVRSFAGERSPLLMIPS